MKKTPTFAIIAVSTMIWALDCHADSSSQGHPNDSSECRHCSTLGAAQLLSVQSSLVDNKLDEILPGRPGETEVYFLGFAGNSDEPVFTSEAQFAERRIAEQYSTRGRSAVLASSIVNVDSEPLASTDNLFRSISAFGDRMDVDEDILFLFLTSHGWKDATLQVTLGELPLEQLRAADLRAALDAAGIRWQIIVISACYAGSFIDSLKSRSTVIMTAASAENTSYGCAPENELTDFGKALFEDAIGSGDGLLEDFRIARSIIRKREKLEGHTPSKPQLYVGWEMEQKLMQLSRSSGR